MSRKSCCRGYNFRFNVFPASKQTLPAYEPVKGRPFLPFRLNSADAPLNWKEAGVDFKRMLAALDREA